MMSYTALPTPCNCSPTSLEEAAQWLGPSFVYTLYVHPRRLIEHRSLLRKLSMDVLDNVFAPYVNLRESYELGPNEWVLQANERKAGSIGC